MSDTTTTAVHATPARILYQQAPADEARWMEIVTGRRAMDPAVFKDRQPVFWPAEISNRRLDSYFTHMGVSTLRNFAQGANDGVSFQNSHRWMELPLGQSVEGTFVEEGDAARALAVFYTLPDLAINGVNTSQFVDAMRAGIIQDVSVGFYGGRFECDICGRDMLRDMECRHWPGFEYEVKDGETTRKVMATATVEDALLSEVSAVYDGATPGAGVLKAQREADAGRLNTQQLRMLEARYRVRLFEPKFGGVTVPEENDKEIETGQETADVTRAALDGMQEAHAVLMTDIGTARAALRTAGAPDGTVVEMAEWVAETIKELRLLADDGRRYRADLIDEALAEGVRGMGKAFSPDLYRALLDGATVPQIKALRDQWRAMGDNQFAGGAVVRNSNEPPREKPGAPVTNQSYT